MSKVEIKNLEGQAAGEAELSSDVFGIEPNVPVMHQVVVAYEASMRQGTHQVKNRHEVSGGGSKPYDGMNIVVTHYSDGTFTATKVMK